MKTTHDIHELKPRLLEKISCDFFGNGCFRLFQVTSISARKIEFSCIEDGMEVEAKIKFIKKSIENNVFWRNESGLLHYQLLTERNNED